MYKWQELNMVEKENLHPGDYSEKKYGYGSLHIGGMQTDSIEEDPITSFSLSKEEECGGPSLAAMRYKLDVVVILEPRISGALANKVIKNWGFKHSIRKEAEGFSGGIWIL
ncbi:hypothetical protein K1719_002516 [Acacia pycnantha]|nr:hypothetical protein K1719_002516 [Acacia pycnantha]